MAESLEGRIALITGAARGMGRAIADVFAREGAAVGLLDVQEVELQQVVEGIRADGGKVIGQVADVRSSDQVEAAVQAVVNQLGPIDILVNSAGLGMPGRVHELAEADWDLCFDVNVKGTFLMCKAVVPMMLERQQGQIINIASLAAWVRGNVARSCYGASKYAVRGFSRYLAVELRPENIRVCCLSPGSTDTHFRGEPTGNPKWMEPEGVAEAALFVAAQRDRVAVAELGISMVSEGW
ncbi:MAG: SDR family oxidoreductase [Candidatus Latescibacteria bacterium]|nr:SDR family oxidoreductase [Candidatus Latescibacterota bacterium]